MVNYTNIKTPLGEMLAVEYDGKLCVLEYTDCRPLEKILSECRNYFKADSRHENSAILSETESQLRAYFAGNLRAFRLPLILIGTPFQSQVWNELCRISYGVTVSYGQLAQKLGKPSAVRAVGRANGQNHIAIVVPCHRVIGANGDLTGYGGELWRKKSLLELEGAIIPDLGKSLS